MKVPVWKHALCGIVLAGLAGGVAAQTLDEDEARIEELMRAPHAAAPAAPAAVAIAPASDNSALETPVVAAVVAPAPTANDEWLAAPQQPDESLPFAELAKNIGKRVSITTSNEREHNGIITSADAKQVTLQVKRAGGNASYTLRRDQVVRVESR
jgi:hypothetical protein